MLLQISLDLAGGPFVRGLGVGTELVEGPTLTQQVPSLVELHFELLHPGPIGTGQALAAVGGAQRLLFRDQLVDVMQDCLLARFGHTADRNGCPAIDVGSARGGSGRDEDHERGP